MGLNTLRSRTERSHDTCIKKLHKIIPVPTNNSVVVVVRSRPLPKPHPSIYATDLHKTYPNFRIYNSFELYMFGAKSCLFSKLLESV